MSLAMRKTLSLLGGGAALALVLTACADEVDPDVVPAVKAERSCAFVRSEAQEGLDRHDVPASGPPSRDPLELAELFERVDPDVRIRAEAHAERALTPLLDRREAVPEVRLRRRAHADPPARVEEEVELVRIGVRRVDDGRPRAEAAALGEQLDGP